GGFQSETIVLLVECGLGDFELVFGAHSGPFARLADRLIRPTLSGAINKWSGGSKRESDDGQKNENEAKQLRSHISTLEVSSRALNAKLERPIVIDNWRLNGILSGAPEQLSTMSPAPVLDQWIEPAMCWSLMTTGMIFCSCNWHFSVPVFLSVWPMFSMASRPLIT